MDKSMEKVIPSLIAKSVQISCAWGWGGVTWVVLSLLCKCDTLKICVIFFTVLRSNTPDKRFIWFGSLCPSQQLWSCWDGQFS